MNFVKNYASSLGVFALAVGLTASQANAQGAKATFNLPFQAHWGDAVLDPGEYSITLPPTAAGSPILQVSGQGKTIMVVAGIFRPMAQSERSYLRLEDFGQEHVVREFRYGVAGKSFIFSVPKSSGKQIRLESSAHGRTVAMAESTGN